MTAASRLLAAVLLLLSSSSPLHEEGPLTRASTTWSGFGVLLAAAKGDQNDEDESVSEDKQEENGEGQHADEEPSLQEGAKGASRALRGAAANKERKNPAAARKELSDVFEGLLSSLGADKESVFFEHSQQAHKLNELLDAIFPPRLQTPPRYHGALEVLNESLYRDVLRGPGKEERSPAALQEAYTYLRKPPLVLVVPALFVELREGADRQKWEDTRRLISRRCHNRGESVPPRYELTADEVHAQAIDDGALWDDEIAPEDLLIRIQIIHGWLKQQYRLRLYHMKRLGTFKGDLQKLVDAFNPGPDLLPVSIEDIEGLSYAAELDDAHIVTEDTEEENDTKNEGRDDDLLAQQTEL
ncbi:hypothetical protein ACSSS7_007646 [Eimeria intestinalis]